MRHCRYCEEPVDLNAEGVQYPNGTCAHEGCHDAEEFTEANQADFA